MANLNKVFLMGRLTRDPELRYTPQGVAVSDLGLAVNREYTAGNGERKKDTLFIDVTVWKKQAEVCCQYLKKGSPLFVEGRLSVDSWEGQDGQKKQRSRVVVENFQFIGGSPGGGRAGAGGEPSVPEGADGPPDADYGGNFRRPGRAGAGQGSQGQGNPTQGSPNQGAHAPGGPNGGGGALPQQLGEEYNPPSEADIPF